MSAALAQDVRDTEPLIEAATFVLSLRARGVSDLRLLRAMETVRREIFAPRRYGDLARQDVALPLPCGETMSAPTTVALMLAALGVQPGMRVLEVGTGSGYVTALLVALGGRVHTVERKSVLFDSARQRLRASGHAADCDMACGDGLLADGDAARFERILLNGSFPDGAVPSAVTSRLAAGGRIVAGTADRPGSTRLLILERQPDGEIVAGRHGASIRLSRFS